VGWGAQGHVAKGGHVGCLDSVRLQVLDWMLCLYKKRSVEVVDKEVYFNITELLLNSNTSMNATNNYDWTLLYIVAH